jgi:hypothetical protein
LTQSLFFREGMTPNFRNVQIKQHYSFIVTVLECLCIDQECLAYIYTVNAILLFYIFI